MPNEADGYGYGYGYGELEDQSESLPLPAQLRDPIGVLRRQHRWILATLFLTSIIVASVTATAPRQYQARETILLTAKSIPDEFVPTTIIANILEQFEAIRGEIFSRDHLSVIIEETGVYADGRQTSTRAALVARLRDDLIVEQLGVNADQVVVGASFIDDLGADSLDTVELVMAFEEEFGLDIPDEDAEKMATVTDVTKYIEEHSKS